MAPPGPGLLRALRAVPASASGFHVPGSNEDALGKINSQVLSPEERSLDLVSVSAAGRARGSVRWLPAPPCRTWSSRTFYKREDQRARS